MPKPSSAQWRTGQELLEKLQSRATYAAFTLRPRAGQNLEIACYEVGRPFETDRRRVYLGAIEVGPDGPKRFVGADGATLPCTDADEALEALSRAYSLYCRRTRDGVSTIGWADL